MTPGSEALSLRIMGMMEDGEAIKEASTLDALADDPAMEGAAAFLVSADVAEKVGRFTARKSEMAEIDFGKNRPDTVIV
jgi:hypothetical protein